MSRATELRFAAVVMLLTLVAGVPAGFAASPSDFSSASASISSAYVAVRNAQAMGGNVTTLVAKLNVALGLYMRAQSENDANPAKAAADLQNATLTAQSVASSSGSVGVQGASAKQTQFYASMVSAASIVLLSALVYFFGDRLYRLVWLRVYANHVVTKTG